MDAVGTRRLYKELDQAARNDPTGLSGVLHSFPKAVLPMGDLRNRHPVILAMPALGGTDISISSCWVVAPHATATIITSCVSRNQPGESARVGYITLTGSVLESSHGSILASAEDNGCPISSGPSDTFGPLATPSYLGAIGVPV